MLAGGRSARMGRDKARVLWQGVPMAVRVACALRDAGLEVSLIRRGARDTGWIWPDGRGLRVLMEPDTGERHPLMGLVTALEDAGSDCVIAPCDVPRIQADDVRALVEAGAPAVAFDGARLHPLIGLYPQGWLADARAAVASGASARAFAASARRVHLPAEHLHNVNEPSDLA